MKQVGWCRCALGAWAAIFSLVALGQVERRLAPVDVVATTPLPGLGQPLIEIAAPVQSADSAAIERSGSLDLGDFLNRGFGSVHVNGMQGNPYQLDVSYRGYTASPLLGTPQGLSVYMDGVRMNQPFGDIVSWDLIPRGAIASLSLMPGSNPLFGLNTLGGALSLQTKDGRSHPGTSLQLTYGSHQRGSAEFEHGGANARGLSWYLYGQAFNETGWRDNSPSRLGQLFGKLGWRTGGTDVNVTLALADSSLVGNGLQEHSALASNWASIYTRPDETRNRSMFLNLAGSHEINDRLLFSGNLYFRRIDSSTLNGDLNGDALGSSIYATSPADQAALDAVGLTGYQTAGTDKSSAPFPFWKCLAQVLQNDEPAEACTGLINRSTTSQTSYGLSGQLTWLGELFGRRNQFMAGVAYDASQVRFTQSTELGYLNADRSVTGTGAFADGVTGGSLNGTPYDTRVDLASDIRSVGVFGSNTLSLADHLHLTLSGRFNRTAVQNRDQIVPAGNPASLTADHVFERFNPAVGLTWSPSKALNTYLGYSESSRAPTAIELGCANPAQPCKLPNAMAGDPPLSQVVTRTLEFGLRGMAPAKLQWSAGVFAAVNQDDILFVSSAASGLGYFKNFGQTRRQGLEFGLGQQLGSLQWRAHYTLLDATYQSPETVNGTANSSNDQAQAGNPGASGVITIRPGDRLPLMPRQMLKLSASYAATPAWRIHASMVAMDGMLARGNENGQHQPDGTVFQGGGSLPGYAVFNLGATYMPSPGLRWSVHITNLFDVRYTTGAQLGASGFDASGAVNADPFGTGVAAQSTFLAPAAPRALSVSLKYTF